MWFKRAGAPIQTGWVNRSANQASVLADDERECIADCSIEETINFVLPTTTDALQLIRNQIIARIQEITLSPKPNYTVDGQTFSWQSYLDSLLKNLGAIDDRIRDSDTGSLLGLLVNAGIISQEKYDEILSVPATP